jgi:hypothetical protein
MRYQAENSGAVLDTKTGLREWFGSHAEAIQEAKERNEDELEDGE